MQIQFSVPVFNVSFDLMHTYEDVVTYTIADDAGSSYSIEVGGSYNIRMTPITLPFVGSRSITITSSQASDWGFGVDNIRYEPENIDLQFDVTPDTPEAERRVLISKKRTDDEFPSEFQTEDGKIQLKGTLTRATGVPLANTTVYFRLVDVADTSAYIPTELRKSGDNKVVASLTAEQTTSAEDGEVATTLVITNASAGDNYRIEAGLTPDFWVGKTTDENGPCASCFHSGTVTAWKRVYAEVDSMFRAGAYLTSDTSGVFVEVNTTKPFKAGDTILLVHGPSPAAEGYWYEDRQIKKVWKNRNELELYTAPSKPYYAQTPMHMSDAVGIVSRPSKYLYTPPIDLLAPFFAEAFVEFHFLGPSEDENGGQFIPFESEISDYGSTTGEAADIASRWGGPRTGNRLHFIGGRASTSAGQKGVHLAGTNYVWIWIEKIEVANPDPDFPKEVTAHEAAHLWGVNVPGLNGARNGHCGHNANTVWLSAHNDPGRRCLMYQELNSPSGSVYAEFLDGILGFHSIVNPEGWISSEYLEIRNAADPLYP